MCPNNVEPLCWSMCNLYLLTCTEVMKAHNDDNSLKKVFFSLCLENSHVILYIVKEGFQSIGCIVTYLIIIVYQLFGES
jgi:hypothetical protein